MGRLSGKVAIVTGAAMGNGKGGAEAYAKHGAHVVLCDVSPVLFETEKEFKEKAIPSAPPSSTCGMARPAAELWTKWWQTTARWISC